MKDSFARYRTLVALTFSGVAVSLLIASFVATGSLRSSAQPHIAALTATQFSDLSRSLSEDAGYFHSDNFTSNETSYLHVVDTLRDLAEPGGAYIGVGPEQNFTYIAKTRPGIAFIVDIRRQAVIQHLMFKAVFQLSPDRGHFLFRLLSIAPIKKMPPADASVEYLLDVVSRQPGDDQTFAANLALVLRMIEKDFAFPLSEGDRSSLELVYRTFREAGLRIAYRTGGWWGGYFPNLKDLIAETDLRGRHQNFLASSEDYDFVRSLHRRNLIIPVVGDFGGTRALASVADYLKTRGITVTAFYTSNVERYLFSGGSFPAFVENVRRFPIDHRSVFIRSIAGGSTHPERRPGHRSTTLLQKIAVFLDDFDTGRHGTYRDLVMTHYIPSKTDRY